MDVISASLVKAARNVAESGNLRLISFVVHTAALRRASLVTLGAGEANAEVMARSPALTQSESARVNFRMVSLFKVIWMSLPKDVSGIYK
jgi:hypothetical protein